MTELMSENMAFFMENGAVDRYTLTATTSATNHPVTELQNSSRKLTWKSTSLASNIITGTWGVPVPPEATLAGRQVGVVFVNHNFPPTIGGDYTNINVKLYDSSLVLKINENFSGVNYTDLQFGAKTAIDLIRPYNSRVCYISGDTDFTLRKWEITLTGVGTFSGTTFWEIGRIYVGPVFQPAQNIFYEDDLLGSVDDTRVNFSKGRDQFSDFGAKVRGLYLTPPPIFWDVSDITDWLYLVHVVGAREPVFVDLHPWKGADFNVAQESEAMLNLLWQMYGVASNNIRFGRKDKNKICISGSMTIVEQA
jgi:hypothetical protein